MAINALIPDGTLGVRDIGLQLNYKGKNNLFETHLGLFNGYGIKEYRFDNQGYMLTHKLEVNFHIHKNLFKIGYSLQYRYAKKLKIPKVLPDSIFYTGKDLRYNFFAMYQSNAFEVQAEYLNAEFKGEQAKGYYLLSAINIGKSQFVLSVEDYKDLIESTENKPYYRIGYNYLINKYKLRLSIDNYFQIDESKFKNYLLSLQIQIFFK